MGPLACDENTVGAAGLQDGDVISIQAPRMTPKGSNKNLRLACTKKKHELLERRRQDELLNGPKYDGYALQKTSYFQKNNLDGNARFMPRWVSQACPHLLAELADEDSGIEGQRGASPRAGFESMPIYLPDQLDKRLSRVRE